MTMYLVPHNLKDFEKDVYVVWCHLNSISSVTLENWKLRSAAGVVFMVHFKENWVQFPNANRAYSLDTFVRVTVLIGVPFHQVLWGWRIAKMDWDGCITFL